MVSINIKKIFWTLFAALLIALCADADNGKLIYTLIVLFFITSLILSRKLPQRNMYQTTIIWYGLFIIYSILSIFWSITYMDSYNMVMLLFRQFLVIFSLSMCINNIEDIYIALKIFLIACTIMMMKLSFYMILGYSGSKMWDEVTGNYFNTVAQILAIAIIIAYFFIKITKLRRKRILYIFFILFSFYHILLTGSRKGLLMPLFGIVIFMLLQSGLNIRRIIINLFILICIFVVITCFLVQNEVFTSRIEIIFNLIFKGNTLDESTTLRMSFIRLAKQMYLNSPIFGCGINTFASQCLINFGRNYYAHNNFYELLSGTGLFGVALYYWIYILSLIKFYILRKKNNIYILGFSVWLTLMVFEYGIVTYSVILYPIILTIFAISYRNDIIRKGGYNVSENR